MVEVTPVHVVRRLVDATYRHDLDGLVGCFAEDYVNETPVHPAREFVGHEQVRRNWTQLFAAVPHITIEALQFVEHGDVVWSEWEMRGTRVDGAPRQRQSVRRRTARGCRCGPAFCRRRSSRPLDGAVSDEAAEEQAFGSSG